MEGEIKFHVKILWSSALEFIILFQSLCEDREDTPQISVQSKLKLYGHPPSLQLDVFFASPKFSKCNI